MSDLISRSALIQHAFTAEFNGKPIDVVALVDVDNAPTVEEITNEDIQQAIKEGFANGYEMAKEKIIHSIAKQYSEHNELVPMWLSIGDIKDGAE